MADEINKQVQSDIEGLNAAVKNGSETLEDYKKKMTGWVDGLRGGDEAAKRWTSSLMDASLMSKTAAASINILSAAILGTSKAFAGFDSNAYGQGFQNISDQIGNSIEPLSKMTGGLGMLAKALNIKAPEGVALTVDYMKKALVSIGENVDAAQAFQNAYLGMSLASGKASELFVAAGKDLSNLNAVLKNQGDMITSVSSSTGIAFPRINDFYMALGKIPGALQATTEATGGATGGVQAWQAAIDIATAGGIALGGPNGAVSQMQEAYDRFGETGDKALEFMARQIELSQNLGIPIEKTTGYVDKMAQAFQFLGDNTKGTSAIFQDMFSRLKDSGVGVEPAIAQVENMTEAMTHMTVAQKAFLSARSGGPGGLMGAMQIEKELKEGKTGEVMDKMRKSLMQQFGGHIVTLDEASRSQQAASQFQRQRELLKSDAFGGLAKTDEQATNLLAALSKPQTAANQKDTGTLLQNLRDQGKTVADQNRTMFTKMGTDVESIKMKGGLELLATVKTGLGVSNESIRRSMEQDRNEAATTAVQANKATDKGQDISDQTTTKNVQGIKNHAVAVLSAIPKLGAALQDKMMAPETPEEQAQKQAGARDDLVRKIQTAKAQPMMPIPTISANETPTTNQQMHATINRLSSMTARKGDTTAASATSTAPKPAGSNKQPIVVNANIYVDGKLVQSHQSHQVAQDLGNHASNPGN